MRHGILHCDCRSLPAARILMLLVLAAAVISAAGAQESDDEARTGEAASTTGAEDSGGTETAGEDESRSALIESSLLLDIETAGHDELAAWDLVLGGDGTGSDEELRRRLRAWYGVSEGGSRGTASSGTRIVIDSAGRSEYMKVELSDGSEESVIRLTGQVVVTVDESDRGRSHRVEADSVIFNQDRKTITAIGDIRYTVDTGGREEHFSGDSLTFEVTDWTGVIFHGTSRRSQEVDGAEVNFFFRGDSIKRAGTDILVLEDGAITSHDTENPDYALKARKIWITGPGEWGMFSATLYVGHIPVFYLPFYWKSGSDLLFNPVIGTRTRMGYYLQTTTYLMGRKEADDGFSIMGFGDSASDDFEEVREGLFLVREPATGSSGAESSNMLKYMLDGYTSLGAMTGFTGSFPSLGKEEKGSFDFYAALGVSRSVTDTGSPYFDTGSSTAVDWNSSFIGELEVPFRWGLEVDVGIDGWTFYADWYSDPYFMTDFGDRKENFDWLGFLLSEEESDGTDSDSVSTLTWEIRGSESFSPETTSPWIQTLSMDTFRTSLTWRNKSNGDYSTTQAPDIYDPARKFFYPDQLILPEIKLSLRGAAPDWKLDRLTPVEIPGTGEEKSTNGTGEPAGDGTWITDGPEGPAAPEYHKSFDTVYDVGLLEATLNYSLNGQLLIEDDAFSDSWNTPSDIDFAFEDARVNSTQRGDFNYGIGFWDGLTGVSGTTNLSGYYQTHADIFGSGIGTTDETKLEDYQYSQFLWDNSFSVFLSPLQGVPSLSSSRITYDFDGNIYAYQFVDGATADDPEYDGAWISGEDDIRTHQAAASLAWTGGPFTLNSSASGNIPPLEQKYTLSSGIDFLLEGWKASVSQQNTYDSGGWSPMPLIMSASWTGWKDEVTLSQNARYDIEEQRWSSAESLFGFWGFETRFIADYGTDYFWETDDLDPNYLQWVSDGESFSPSTLKFAYDRDFDPKPLWKNRITTRTELDLSWDINLRQVTDNVLTFTWSQEFNIYKFLDLRIDYSSTNNSMYLYFEAWRDRLGIDESHSFFGDLAKSFNIFDVEDRRDSPFNMNRIDVDLIHHLRNWDLTLEYGGWPALDSDAGVYTWKSELSIYVKWNPLPMFNQTTRYEDDDWSVDSFETDS